MKKWTRGRLCKICVLVVACMIVMPPIAYADELDNREVLNEAVVEQGEFGSAENAVQGDSAEDAPQDNQSLEDGSDIHEEVEHQEEVSSEESSDTASDGESIADENEPVEGVEETPVDPAGGSLVRDEVGIKYVCQDGRALTNSFYTVGANTYYFGADGYALAGMQEIGGRFYYFDNDTYAQHFGWHAWEDGTRSYFARDLNGAAAKGWWVLADSSDVSEGATNRYYFDGATRRTLSGIQAVDGKLYWLSPEGFAQYGWYTWDDGLKTYFARDARGAAAKGKWTIDGKVYFFEGDARKTKVGWHTWEDDSRSYFAADTGYAAAKGKWVIDGKMYLFNNKRLATIGWYTWEDGKRSYFASSAGGAAAKGWWSIDGKRYYFHRTTRKTLKGRWKIDGQYYYFSADGSRYSGWISWNSGGYSYFGSNGVMRTGYNWINGIGVTFDSNGKVYNNPQVKMVVKAQKCTSATNYLLMVNTKENWTGVFTRGSNGWDMKYYWRCSTGSLGVHQTPSGTFATGYKGYSFGEQYGYSCYWYTQIKGQVLFHSVKYYAWSSTPMDGRLGMNISDGCVRLDIDNAKWIYDNIPRNTTVRVYFG